MKRILLALLAVTTIHTANAQVSLSQLDSLSYFEQIELIEGTEKAEGLKEQMTDAQLKRYFRYRAFWDDRIDSEGSFISYMNAWKNYHNETKSGGSRNSNEPSLLFEQIGPFENSLNKTNFMGRAMSVSVDPNNPNIVYVGGATGGLWKSTNALANASDVEWECLTDDFSAIGVKDIVINPNNSNEIYFIASFYSVAVTNSKLYSAGIYKSTDGGQSWTCDMDINPADEIMLTRIVYHPNNTNIMYALGLNMLFKKDGGTWSQITSNNGPLSEANQLWEIAINPQNPDEIYASGKIFTTKDDDDNTIYYDEFGLYKSSDGGYSFVDITDNVVHDTAYHCNYISVDYNPQNNHPYVACEMGNKYTEDSLYYHNGSDWELIYEGKLDIASYVNEIDIAPNGDCYVGGRYMYYSNNYSDFHELDDGYPDQIHQDIRDVGFSNTSDGAPVFIVTDGGVCRSTTGGYQNWESINGNLCLSQFFDFDITDDDTELMVGGTLDCGTLRRNPDGTWSHVLASDGGGSGIDNFDKNIGLASYGSGKQNIKYTTDGHNSYHNSMINNDTTEYKGIVYNMPTHFSYHQSGRVYSGTWHLVWSNDGGQNFSYHVNAQGTGPGQVTAIGESRNYSSYFAFGSAARTSSTGIDNACIHLNYYYDPNNPGDGWQTFTEDNIIIWGEDPEGFDACPITDIVFSEINEETVYIALGGFQDGLKVLKSDFSTGSKTVVWINKTFNLENIPVNSVAESNDGYLFAATDFGLYYLEDGGSTWYKYEGNNFPDLPVNEILINNTSGEMILSTFGRGAWRSDLYCGYDSGESETISSNTTWSNRKKVLGDLTINNSASLTVTNELRLSDQSTITINDGASLIIDNGGIIKDGCDNYFAGTINVEPGGTLDLREGGKIQMGEDGLIDVKHGTSANGLLEYNGTTEGGKIILNDDNTCLNISGELFIASDMAFTYSGAGYIKFSNPGGDATNNIFCGTNSSIVLQGSGPE